MKRIDPQRLNSPVHLSSERRMLAFLQQFLRKPKVKRVKMLTFRLKAVKKRYSLEYKANVTYRRYHSLTDISVIHCSRSQLAKHFGVPLKTIHDWIKKHRRDRGSLWNPKPRLGRPPRRFAQWQLDAMVSRQAINE